MVLGGLPFFPPFLPSFMEPFAFLQEDPSLQLTGPLSFPVIDLTQLVLGSSEVHLMKAWCCVTLFPLCVMESM